MSSVCKTMDFGCIPLRLRDVISLTDKFFTTKIKERGLPILMNHMALFYILDSSVEPLAFTEILNSWEVSKSSLSEVINKYSNLGLIEKISSVDDKRSFTVVLTDEGKKIKKELDLMADELLAKFYSSFDDEERQKFETNVDDIICNLNEI